MPINETASVTNCDTNFEPLIENLKLFLQLCYLTPSALFLSRVIYITAWKYRKKFRKQRFYTIFLADCVTGFILVNFSIFFTRPLIYVPQACEFVLEHIKKLALFLDIYYPCFRYLQAFQILVQILFVANRASCVLWPLSYSLFWKKWLKSILTTMAISPCLWIWTIAISDKMIVHGYGGLVVLYYRYVSWARSTLFFSILRLTSVITIVVATTTMLIKMSRMKKRIRESERRLCWASVYLSVCYLLPAIAEFEYFLVLKAKLFENSGILHGLVVICWDIQNICSTYVM
ncbi:Serpentine receptor class gamma-1 [Caenorhabditis elegans]|uniref:Serpentine receptor class gamma-1 n=1 Tax=Caenorhabditis elegans TaxID=6239 RepID=SRG1_CAEEL|nr:Serpentine receptor class gamma-1 [Caenorhabditis elegans]P46570.2 RecName: Full=Serpentine receptor class gamma-1; Short=Protein srg-1 [Caenorhabditis elegans]CCD65208.1 Serpentine receptor class gamma-1 [Caenorhabditis elegans]|eukprot:NP_498366.2 Serpentine receptor class gamma-1 [Caenorhabditis elegans]